MPSTFRPHWPSSPVRSPTPGWHVILHAGRLLFLAGSVALLAGCASHASARPALHRVTIHAFKFEPDSFSSAPGDTVEWLNQDIVPHTSTARSSHWDSGSIPPGGSWRTVLTLPGAEPYGCQLHTLMQAQLAVR